MAPRPKSQHAQAHQPAAKARAAARRRGRVLRDHLPDGSPLLRGLGGRRVITLGPISVDGGAPAQALARAAGAVVDGLPDWLLMAIAYGNATVLYEHGVE
jgi:hypothetical protein